MALNQGQLLQNRYRVVTLLGEGGMGAVYRAWDLRLKVSVALKEMTPQPGLEVSMLAQLRGQFEQEAVTLARLSHPHLVRVTDFFDELGNAYLVMEYLEGESLAQRIQREGRIPEAQTLTWARQLLDALAYCHAQGIVHRDIKPQNILLRPDGRAVLVDFGLVKLWNPADPQTHTVMRGMGTPEYAPPEQYGQRGQTTDPRSDIYSLGATLYHALTGQAPPSASDRIADPEIFRPVRALNPSVSAATDAAILKALEPTRAARWTTAAHMLSALSRGDQPSAGLFGIFTSAQARAPRTVASTTQPPTGSSAAVMPGARPKGAGPLGPWVWAVIGCGVLLFFLIIGLNSRPPRTPSAVTPAADHTATSRALQAQTATAQAVATRDFLLTLTAEAGATPTARVADIVGSNPTTVTLRQADGMVQVYVPAGEFRMGVDGSYDFLAPEHTVILDAFWLDQTEVSVAQFRRFVNATGYQTAAERKGSSLAHISGTWGELNGADWVHPTGPNSQAVDNHPVVHVSAEDAVAYCQWVGARLPTEAEWEYAARGPQNRVFPWGNDFDGTRLNYCDTRCTLGRRDPNWNDGYEQAAPLGSYSRGVSWVGALDLGGNVYEWVSDWFGWYPSETQTNPAGPAGPDRRILRGGSWDSSYLWLLTYYRHLVAADETSIVAGFRCVVPAR
ncbi:MAG: SUMF1/EgtB/PvdO family nonheme iron enzyme [Anaerolineae bacterium]|nr:SUMF1/EgtB/PvdO family nonheme iron enzyme [Anaerolineae bacterium]